MSSNADNHYFKGFNHLILKRNLKTLLLYIEDCLHETQIAYGSDS